MMSPKLSPILLGSKDKRAIVTKIVTKLRALQGNVGQ
jgi:hypothetical protein